MRNSMIRLTSFDAGEVDEIVFKRADTKYYTRAGKSLLNVEVTATGAPVKRRGTSFVLGLSDLPGVAPTEPQFPYRAYPLSDGNGNYYLLIACNNVTSGSTIRIYQQSTDTTSLTHITDLNVPYEQADYSTIQYAAIDGTIVFVHQNYSPARIYYNTVASAWQYQKFIASTTIATSTDPLWPQPAYDFNIVNYSGCAVTVAQVASGDPLLLAFTFAPDPGFTENGWAGGQLVGAGATVDSPIGYGIIREVVIAGGNAIVYVDVNVQFYIPSSSVGGSAYSVRQPVFSGMHSYPKTVTFYQSRLIFGGTSALPNTIFGSHINNYLNFDVGIGRDTDALIYTIGQSTTNGIIALNAGKQFEIYTKHYELVVPQSQGQPLTPSTFSVLSQSSYGSSELCRPISYLNDTYYIASNGKAIMNYQFNGVGLSYTSTNVSFYAQHLVNNPTQRALLRSTLSTQDTFIYFTRLNDASLMSNQITCFQFINQFKNNELGGCLTPFSFNCGKIFDIVELNNTIYIIANFGANHPALTPYASIVRFDEAVRMDNAMNATMTGGLITGLGDYVGATFAILLNDPNYIESFGIQYYGEYVVSNAGTIQVPFDVAPIQDPVQVLIGYLYDYVVEPLDYFAGANSVYDFKNVSRIYVDYQNTIGLTVNGVTVPYLQYSNVGFLEPVTDTFIMGNTSGYSRFDGLKITQRAPFDAQITSIGYQISSSII